MAYIEATKDEEMHMDKILENLYIGDVDDSLDRHQLNDHKIRRIVRIDAEPRTMPVQKAKHKMKYLFVEMEDKLDVDLIQPIGPVNKFIHEGRINGEAVLVHCSAGKNRSISLTAAYLTTVTNHCMDDVIEAIRIVRNKAGPHVEYLDQLHYFESKGGPKKARAALEDEFGPLDIQADHKYISKILERRHGL